MDKVILPFIRIKPPKFRIGRYVLNEYELRCLMAEVAEGKRPPGLIVKEDSHTAEIIADGSLSKNLPGLSICTNATLRLIRKRREVTNKG